MKRIKNLPSASLAALLDILRPSFDCPCGDSACASWYYFQFHNDACVLQYTGGTKKTKTIEKYLFTVVKISMP